MQQVVPMLCLSLPCLHHPASQCMYRQCTHRGLCYSANIYRDMESCPCRPALPAGVSCTHSCLTPGGGGGGCFC